MAYVTLADDIQALARAHGDTPELPALPPDLFTYGERHMFLPIREIVDIVAPLLCRLHSSTETLHLGLVRTIAFLVKNEWERHIAAVCGWPAVMQNLKLILDEEASSPRGGFQVDEARLWDVVEGAGELASRCGLTRDLFTGLVRQIILLGVHRAPNGGREARDAAEMARNEVAMFTLGSAEDQQRFLQAKTDWLKLRADLGDTLLDYGQLRLRQAHVRSEWLGRFGRWYVRLQTATYRLHQLGRKLELAESDPALGERDIDGLLAGLDEKDRNALGALEREARMATALWRLPYTASSIDPEDFAKLLDRTKRLLVELKLTLHPDHLEQNPRYLALRDDQKQQLKEIFGCYSAIHWSDLVKNPGTIGYEYPDAARLQSALAYANEVLGHAGSDLDVTAIIHGQGLGERIGWLESEIRIVRQSIHEVDDQRMTLLGDPETRLFANQLAAPERHADIESRLRDQATEIEQRASELEARVARLFQRPKEDHHDAAVPGTPS